MIQMAQGQIRLNLTTVTKFGFHNEGNARSAKYHPHKEKDSGLWSYRFLFTPLFVQCLHV
jgi:hypothetical protein